VTKPEKSPAALAYEKRCSDDLASARKLFAELEGLTGARNIATVLEPLDRLSRLLDGGVNGAGLLRNVHPDPTLRAVAESCEQEFSKLATDVGLSRPIFESVSRVDVEKADAPTRRWVELTLRDFRRAGVDKDEPTRQKIRALRDDLVKIGQEFEKNVRENVRSIELDSAEKLAGLPQDYRDAHRPGAGGRIAITTDYTDYIPFMTYARDDAARLALYREFRKRGYPANGEVLNQLLAKRYQLARLLGYDNWAVYITEDKMIKTARAAHAFIDKIARVAEKRARQDYDELLRELQREQPAATDVGDWQKAYVEEKLKRTRYAFDSQEVRRYFPYDSVKNGILGVTARLFGLTYRKVDRAAWDASVEAYDVLDGGDVIGTFFLDMHPRAGKYKHAAAFPMRTGVAGKQLPEAALVCNFPGGDGTPGLMEHGDVVTFFHEFGHLLHHLLGGRQRWLGISGLNVEWDFVEAPSQMLEEWGWDGGVLESFARNAQGEVIPDQLVRRMRAARDFGKGLQARHQMFYAALSLEFHDRDPKGLDTTELMKQLQREYSPFAYVDDTFMHYSFGHLDAYSAIYYTYMWSLVIAKDLFSVFQGKGLLDPEPAARYRKYVLETGGSKEAAVMVKEFLGRDYSFDAFATWLDAG
jgi:thimet oligopeptidase